MVTRFALAFSLLAFPVLGTPASSEGLGAPRIVLAQAALGEAQPSRRGAQKGEKREPTAGQMAARERQKKCGAEWRKAKTDGKVEAGMKWPQYWSKCNSRLKGNNV